MYGINDTIVYGAQGICTIVDKMQQKIGGVRSEYYVLRPYYDKNATILVPVGNRALLDKMRPCITKEETEKVIEIMALADDTWVDDDAARRREFSEITASGDVCRLAELIAQIHRHGRKQKSLGKTVHAADEKVQKEAERMLFEEIAYSLHIRPAEVLPYLLERIERKKR